MKKNISKLDGGYVGLVMLLIALAIIALVIVRTDIFRGGNSTGDNSKNIIEQGSDAVKSAKDVKNLIEQNNRNVLEQ